MTHTTPTPEAETITLEEQRRAEALVDALMFWTPRGAPVAYDLTRAQALILVASFARAAEERGRGEERACACLMFAPPEANQLLGVDQHVCKTHEGRGVFTLSTIKAPTCCGSCSELCAADRLPPA